jgi:hypothetical protein
VATKTKAVQTDDMFATCSSDGTFVLRTQAQEESKLVETFLNGQQLLGQNL